MKRKILMIAAGLAVALMAAAAPTALAAAPAPHSAGASGAQSAATLTLRPSATGGTTICAHTNPKYCADVVGNSNKVGAKIWLYPNGADDHWDIVLADQGCSIISIPCYWIKDVQNTSLCLSATGTSGAPIELQKCGDTGTWYNEGSYKLGNGDYGARANLDVQAIGTHDYLYGLNSLNGGKYQQFTVIGWN